MGVRLEGICLHRTITPERQSHTPDWGRDREPVASSSSVQIICYQLKDSRYPKVYQQMHTLRHPRLGDKCIYRYYLYPLNTIVLGAGETAQCLPGSLLL